MKSILNFLTGLVPIAPIIIGNLVIIVMGLLVFL